MKARDLAEKLEARKLDVLRHLLPGGRVVGHEFLAGNLAGDAGKSLKVALNGKGTVWSDFATGESGADLLDLWAAARCGGKVADAMREAADWLGLEHSTREKSAKPPAAHPTLGKPAAIFEYTSPSGRPIGFVYRWEARGAERKQLRPLAWRDGAWRWEAFAEPRPLYGLAGLAAHPDALVLIVEGEKAADGAALLLPDLVAMTWPGGTSAVTHIDWRPLAGRRCILWPDNDDAGRAAMRKAAALVLEARALEARVVVLPSDLPPNWDLGDPMPDGWTVETVGELIREAKPIGPDAAADAATGEAGAFRPVAFEPFDPASMPRRPWLLGHSILRRAPTAISAPGGSNKTTLLLQRAIAICTGRPITGERVWQTGGAWYLSAEEDRDEILRRVAAICLEFGVPQEELRGKLLMGAEDAPTITLAELDDGNAIATIDVDRMVATALQHGVAFIGIDPLVQFHKVAENANEMMAVVVRQCALIAERSGAAVEFAAHSRKGAVAGDPDGNRGASAIRDGVRGLETLSVMTLEEAEANGIKEDERRRFVRLDNAKGNYSPPDQPVAWFRRVGVTLGNGNGAIPADEVGVLRLFDMTAKAAEAEAERARTEEPERQTLAQALSDAMSGDRCPMAPLIGVAMDHGKPCKERAARQRIADAVPMHPGFRRVDHAGKPHRLFLTRRDQDNPKCRIEVARCIEPE